MSDQTIENRFAARAAKALRGSLAGIEQVAGETGQVEQDAEAEEAAWIDGVSIAISPYIAAAISSSRCRRCADCLNMSHHWLDNSDFGNGDPEAEHPEAEYVCKHCDATGAECEECSGSGITEDGCACESCDLEGVIPTSDRIAKPGEKT